jgi:hypothetical protein
MVWSLANKPEVEVYSTTSICVDGVRCNVIEPNRAIRVMIGNKVMPPALYFEAGSGHIPFFIDRPECPGVACSQHSLNGPALMHIMRGGAVRTSGHRYSA